MRTKEKIEWNRVEREEGVMKTLLERLYVIRKVLIPVVRKFLCGRVVKSTESSGVTVGTEVGVIRRTSVTRRSVEENSL